MTVLAHKYQSTTAMERSALRPQVAYTVEKLP
jgi:hypothetical protein